MRYDGMHSWSNRETLLANMWLNGTLMVDQESSMEITPEYVRELVTEMVEDQMPKYGLARDLFNCALARINCREIAEHYPQSEEV